MSDLPDTSRDPVRGKTESARGPDGWENWGAYLLDQNARGNAQEIAYYTDSHLVGEIVEGLKAPTCF